VGQGVTTGNKKMRRETLNVYCKPMRAKTTKLYLPNFEKSREIQKKELVAKGFFNTVDRDQSGTLSRYELMTALNDFGFSQDEKDTIFSLVDADGSGSVTLNEFCQGISNTNVQIEGRTSKSNRMESYHAIALSLSKSVQSKCKGDKIGPGSFAQIFRYLVSFATEHRLLSFESNSCVFAPPKVSAICMQGALPSLNLRKNSVGCNTMYAVMNPFDAKVLRALSPHASLDNSLEEEEEEHDKYEFFPIPPHTPDTNNRVPTPSSMTETLLNRRRRKTGGVTIDPTLDPYKSDPVSRAQTAENAPIDLYRGYTPTSNPSKAIQAGASSFSRQRSAIGNRVHSPAKRRSVEFEDATPRCVYVGGVGLCVCARHASVFLIRRMTSGQ